MNSNIHQVLTLSLSLSLSLSLLSLSFPLFLSPSLSLCLSLSPFLCPSFTFSLPLHPLSWITSIIRRIARESDKTRRGWDGLALQHEHTLTREQGVSQWLRYRCVLLSLSGSGWAQLLQQNYASICFSIPKEYEQLARVEEV